MDFSNEDALLPVLSQLLPVCAGFTGAVWRFEGKSDSGMADFALQSLE